MLEKRCSVEIKIRLLKLGKKQKDLLEPLEQMGHILTKDVLSRIISGERNYPEVGVAIQSILKKWEDERNVYSRSD